MTVPSATSRTNAEREALEDMVYQFAYWSDSVGGLWTGGLLALEEAFDVLGWEDPKPMPELRCERPGCMGRFTCGWKNEAGEYQRTCGDHYHSERPR